MLMSESVSIHNILPVSIITCMSIGSNDLRHAWIYLVYTLEPFRCIQKIGLHSRERTRELEIICHADFARSFPGRDADDSVSALDAVQSRSCRILQDLDLLDHGRVKMLDVLDLQAVYYKQRASVSCICGESTQTQPCCLARRSGHVHDIQTGSLSLQCSTRVSDRPADKIVLGDYRLCFLAVEAVQEKDGGNCDEKLFHMAFEYIVPT